MTVAIGPRPAANREQHRNSVMPFEPLCECCKPHARHHFGDDLMCLCGLSYQEHQAEPQECDVEAKLGSLRDRACKRGHPRTDDFGWYRKASRNGRPAWVCGKCKELWESGRGRR